MNYLKNLYARWIITFYPKSEEAKKILQEERFKRDKESETNFQEVMDFVVTSENPNPHIKLLW